MKKKSLYLILLLVVVSACKFPQKSSGGGGGGGIPSLNDFDAYLDSATSSEIDKCSSLSVEEQVASRKYPVIKNSGANAWPDTHSQYIEEQFNKPYMKPLRTRPLIAKDLAMIDCPGYNNGSEAEKMKFWMIWNSAVAYAESSLNTSLASYETFDKTYSTGLLQIDFASANRHCQHLLKDMNLTSFTLADMKNPKINLQCGLIMMQRQMLGVPGNANGETVQNRPELEGRLFTDKFWYWAVVDARPSRQKTIDWFKVHAKRQLPFCQRTTIDLAVGEKDIQFVKDGKLSSRSNLHCKKSLSAEKYQDCLQTQNRDLEESDATISGPALQAGEQIPTKEESCNIVNDNSRNSKPDISAGGTADTFGTSGIEK